MKHKLKTIAVLSCFFFLSCVMRPSQYERDLEQIPQAPATPMATPAPSIPPPTASASPPTALGHPRPVGASGSFQRVQGQPQAQEELEKEISEEPQDETVYDYFYLHAPQGTELRKKIKAP